ncbi:DUF418 domain-containing protein [Seonamhaeicola marinus]|uniref:DUF418 domain-containing protein n=1 Tax=Seonamhaeicola marinus TaxID=1912246 RepID=A0A5D0HJA7_9FLAO|nr:DUF418 domain-containing protein [Seonamhaeicola marinus]TYA71368.1 DUF418 domain-containing protein [Seonamhaeicola marinus]
MNKNRIVLIDALRGIALAGILLLHHIEHFGIYLKPTYTIPWLKTLDKWVWDTLFLLFSGKSFALFSLLFGLSYWILYSNRKAAGDRYFFRHIWRMVLLLGFALIHMIFQGGEILSKYAIFGLTLIIIPFLKNRTLLFLSLLLLLDPLRIYGLICHFIEGAVINFKVPYPKAKTQEILTTGTFWDVLEYNFTMGWKRSYVWYINAGRMFTIPGLFFLGAYLSKTKAFTQKSLKFWYSVLCFSSVIWLLTGLGTRLGELTNTPNFIKTLNALLDTYTKFAIMLFVVSLIVILWRQHKGQVWISRFATFGRMGLTNYILIAVIGTFMYYGWGLGLYRYCGSALTLCIAIVILILQMRFSSWWLKHHTYGPLEKLWRKLTWIKFKKLT